jgi:hypothetical protein
MPTIEFHGFSASSLTSITGAVTDAVRRNTFASEIVLVYGQGDQVVDLDNRAHPFLRILSTLPERAAILRQQLTPIADVEVVLIEFYERNSPSRG